MLGILDLRHEVVEEEEGSSGPGGVRSLKSLGALHEMLPAALVLGLA